MLLSALLAIDFSIYHQGCFASKSTEKFPGIRARILTSTVYNDRKASSVMYACSAEKEEIEEYLHYWRNKNPVVNLNVLCREESDVIFNVSLFSPIGWVTKAVLDHGGIFPTPIPVIRGLEKWNVLLPNEGRKRSLFSELDALGVVKVDQVRQMHLNEMLSTETVIHPPGLSSRQNQVLRVAVESGYFESPRIVRSRDLAARIGIAQSTFLEHLRKAQLKLMRTALRGTQNQSLN
jgi:predicted DNA binding protein